MKLTLNGKTIDSQASTLTELLDEQGYGADSRVATAVNGKFVAKTIRKNHQIHSGDSIEVVAPMQGG